MKIIFRLFHKYSQFQSRINFKLYKMPFQKMLLRKCGKKVTIGSNCSFYKYDNVEIGNNVNIGANCSFLSSKAKIILKNDIVVSPGVTFTTDDQRADIVGMKNIDFLKKDNFFFTDHDIVIEDDVWIGANVTILKGVTIGRGSVVIAGSVVKDSLGEYGIFEGVPAVKIKDRFSEEELKKHKEILGG